VFAMRHYHHHHHPAVHQRKFDRLLSRLQARLPGRAGRAMAWLIGPSASLLRLPLAVLFIIGGVFSFLPVLGVWMLPLGILLIAVDVALVRRWVVKTWPWVESRWRLRSRRKRMRWRRALPDGAHGAGATRAISSAQMSKPK
jgi:hypothetical protein